MTFRRWLLAGVVSFAWGCAGEPEKQPEPQEEPQVVTTPPVLVRQDEASREACAHGGSVVRSGLDDDGDGVLDDSEVQKTTLVCHPEPPPPEEPLASLVRLDPVPAGESCGQGGTAVHSGLDSNRNGTLDDAEIQHTDLICRERLLTRLSASPAGERCPDRGVVIDFGRDLDGDGVLSDDEVVATEVECSDVVSRAITVHTASELAALAPIRTIVGNLDIVDTGLETVSLPNLEVVTGRLALDGNVSLTSLSLPSLVSVGGFLDLAENPLLERVDFAKLQRVEGTLNIADNARLTTVSGWPRLSLVGALRLYKNPSLVDAKGFTSLALIREELYVAENTSLAHFGLVSFDDLASVTVVNNPVLQELSLSALLWGASAPTLGNTLVSNNPALKTLRLGFVRVKGNLQLHGNTSLAQVNLDAQSIEGDLSLRETPALTRLHAFDLETVTGNLILSAPLEELYFGLYSIDVGGSLVVSGTRLKELDRRWHVSTVGKDVRVERNEAMTYVDLRSVGGSLELTNNPVLWDVMLVENESLDGDLRVSGNDSLDSLAGLQWVREIRGDVFISGGPKMTRLNMHGLTFIGGDLDVRGSSFESIGLARLTRIEGALRIGQTGLTRWEGLGALTEAGALSVYHNPKLRELKLPLLNSAEYIQIYENPLLGQLSLAAFRWSGSVFVWNNPALPACQVEQLFSQLPAYASTHQEGNDEAALCASP